MLSLPVISDVESVGEATLADLLLHPLRQTILKEARRPVTAAEVARTVQLPPQKVNYHVRTLVDAGFLVPAGEGRKGNLVERRYRASARSYLLLPSVLGGISPDELTPADQFSASHLLRLSSALQTELNNALEEGARTGRPVPTLSLDVDFGLDSPEQRNQFAEALQQAITDVVGRFTSPAPERPDGARRSFRLVLGCYPIPDAGHEPESSSSGSAQDLP